MENTKRVRKKRFNILKFLVFILFLYILISALIYVLEVSIKNIVVLDTYYLSDEEVIETAKLDNYPSFLKTTSYSIKKRLKKNLLINNVKVKKRWGYKVILEIEEKKILYISRSDNLYALNTGEKVELSNINGIPVLINFVPDKISEKFNNKMKKLTIDSISKISEIEYSPTTYDEERFILYMNDSNMVYISINKLDKINKYNEIVSKLEGHTGILYLDSGNYFEIKE